jgi:hypothetical protein
VNRLKAPIFTFLKPHEDAVTEQEIKEEVEGDNRHKQTVLRERVAAGRVHRQGTGGRGGSFPYKCSLAHFSIEKKSGSENLEEGISQQKDERYAHFNPSLNSDAASEYQSEKSENQAGWEDER